MTEIDSKTVKIFWATRKSLVVSLLVVLIGFVLVSLVVIPQFQEALDLYGDLEKEKPKLEKLESKLVELQNIEVSPEFAQVETVEKALPSKKPLLELMVGLSSVSQETSTIVTNFELSPGIVATDSTQVETKGQSDYDQLSLDLTIQGTFIQIQDFLLKVEEVFPFTTIVSMEIGNQLNTNSSTFSTSENSTFEAELTTETYFFTQPIEATIGSPLPKIAARELDVLNFLASFKPSDLQDQTEIRGGGLEDLFQIKQELEAGISGEEVSVLPTPIPATSTLPTASPVAAGTTN